MAGQVLFSLCGPAIGKCDLAIHASGNCCIAHMVMNIRTTVEAFLLLEILCMHSMISKVLFHDFTIAVLLFFNFVLFFGLIYNSFPHPVKSSKCMNVSFKYGFLYMHKSYITVFVHIHVRKCNYYNESSLLCIPSYAVHLTHAPFSLRSTFPFAL